MRVFLVGERPWNWRMMEFKIKAQWLKLMFGKDSLRIIDGGERFQVLIGVMEPSRAQRGRLQDAP